MSTESSWVQNSTDEDLSDDFLFTEDDLDASIGDRLMLSYFVANKRVFIDRTPCRTSLLTGKMYMLEILNGHPDVCHRNFRMQKHVFINFCDTLKHKGLLTDGKKVSVEEGVAMFLMIVGHTTRYSIIGDRFQHSNNTIHKWFKRVLRAVCSLGTEIISPTNQNGPHERLLRKYPFFKNCIGAIDGMHVAAWVPASRQTSFRGRKTNVTQNVMLACNFDMKFIFVHAGWEDQFYLVDSGYPNMPGFLAPYRGRRYHLRDYLGRGGPRGKEELFNYKHFSCRNIIERCIGVLKEDFLDRLFTEYSVDNMVFDDMSESNQDREAIHFDTSQTAQIGEVRDQIATQMWNQYQGTRT
ncbi:uncharacterized protein LOC127804376 [Diospyros lotus]|uniref:uncharacterized protein LOC127804376 n=1 Tax=Diospyros lotus TaxID=55363 RepID=UPI00225A3B71|nr:uncharacterized protein LOC127804376 [Diospyros lotus]